MIPAGRTRSSPRWSPATSWTAVLDAVRLGPTTTDRGDRRPAAGPGRAAADGRAHHDGDPDILVVLDAGYDVHRLAFLLADLPVQLLGRLRADRVPCSRPRRDAPAEAAPATARNGVRPRAPRDRPPRRCRPPPAPPATAPRTPRPGTGCTRGWSTAAPGPTTPATSRSSRAPSSACGSITCPASRTRNRCGCGGRHRRHPADVDRCWQAFLRRFDLEHTFRLFKQTLGWTAPSSGPGRRRPLDLAGHRRAHPAPTGPRPHR